MFSQSQNHSVGRNLRRLSGANSCSDQGQHWNHIGLFRTWCNEVLKTCKDGDSSVSPGNLFQCLNILVFSYFFLHIQLHLSNEPSSIFLVASSYAWAGCFEVFWKLSLLQTKQGPSLRLSSKGKCSSPLNTSVLVCSTFSNLSASFLNRGPQNCT